MIALDIVRKGSENNSCNINFDYNIHRRCDAFIWRGVWINVTLTTFPPCLSMEWTFIDHAIMAQFKQSSMNSPLPSNGILHVRNRLSSFKHIANAPRQTQLIPTTNLSDVSHRSWLMSAALLNGFFIRSWHFQHTILSGSNIWLSVIQKPIQEQREMTSRIQLFRKCTQQSFNEPNWWKLGDGLTTVIICFAQIKQTMETNHLAKSLKVITFYGNSLVQAIDEVRHLCVTVFRSTKHFLENRQFHRISFLFDFLCEYFHPFQSISSRDTQKTIPIKNVSCSFSIYSVENERFFLLEISIFSLTLLGFFVRSLFVES